MTDQSNFEKLQEFNEAAERGSEWPPSYNSVALRLNLLNEELKEFTDEFEAANQLEDDGYTWKYEPERIDKKKVAKELIDLLYVAYDAAVAFGIDADRVFAEVHRSNMSKFVDGKAVRREDGKILKGPNYTPPNLDFVNS